MDGIIDIIIAVLFIAIPAIFKAIGNKLEKSGSERAGKFKKIAEAFGDEHVNEEDVENEPAFEVWLPENMEPVPEVVIKPVAERPKPIVVEAQPAVKKKPMMLIEDEPKRGEKIDPKKLVVYSEIMKPKF